MAVTPGYVVIQTDDGVMEVKDTPANRALSISQGFSSSGAFGASSGSSTSFNTSDDSPTPVGFGGDEPIRVVYPGITPGTGGRAGGSGIALPPKEKPTGAVPTPPKEPEQQPVTLTEKEFADYESMPPQKKFDLLVGQGAIPTGSVLVVHDDGTWGYKTKEDKEAEEEFERNNVKLDNGEYISKFNFDKMTDEQKDYLKKNGVEKFNEEYSKAWRSNEVPPLTDFIDNYFKEKGWLGGSVPGTDITMANNSNKLMDYYNKHLREARDDYEKEYGQSRYVSEVFSTLPEKSLTLFPGLSLVPIGGSLLAISVPIAKGKLGAKGWAGVNAGEVLVGVLGLVSLESQVTNIGEKIAEGNITSKWQRLAYTSPTAKYFPPTGEAFKPHLSSQNQKELDDAFNLALKNAARYPDNSYLRPEMEELPVMKNLKVFGEAGEKTSYIFTGEKNSDIYLLSPSKPSLKGGTENKFLFLKNPKVGADLFVGEGGVNLNFGDLNPPIFVKLPTTGSGTATATTVNTSTMTPENVARLLGFEALATTYNAPLIVNVPKLGGAFIIPPLPSTVGKPRKSNVISSKKLISIAKTPYIDFQKAQSIETVQSPATASSVKVATKTTTGTRSGTAQATRTTTKTDTKTQTKTETQTHVKPETKSPVPSPGMPPVEQIPKIQPPVEEGKPVPPEHTPDIKIILPLGKKGSKKEEKKVYKPEDGAIAWQQGQLRGQPVINTFERPYKSNDDLKTTVGDVPQGAALATGEGSAQRSARLLKGRGPKNVNVDVGAQDLNIQSKGTNVTLTFTPDPEGKTSYPISVGGRPPRISGRTKLPHGRTPRLTRSARLR